jgi:predicted metalloprotease with PDZ domain
MTSQGQANVAYRLSVTAPQTHRIGVELTIELEKPRRDLRLEMAAWAPGSYLIRDFARQVSDVTVVDDKGDKRAFEKIDKNSWQIDVQGAKRIVVAYDVYAYELTPRTNHMDGTHAMIQGPATYLFAPELRDQPVTVEVEAPAGWYIATGLEVFGKRFRAKNVDELLDCPIHVSPNPSSSFTAAGKSFELAVWGQPDRGEFTLAQLEADLKRIIEAHVDRIDDPLPFDRYVFILMLSPGKYGGLEHKNSSVNLHTPYAFADRNGYFDLLELLSHEFFHIWNGKRIFPSVFERFNYGSENYTRALWVVEGMTSYYDRLTLAQTATMTLPRFFEKLCEEWGTLVQTPGARRQSLESASFDAWVKFYRPDEDSINTSVSYYLKGGIVFMCLDFEIRRQSRGQKSLDDVVRHLWKEFGKHGRGYPEALLPVFESATGTSLATFFERFVRGTEDPDLPGYLADVGLILAAESPKDQATGEERPEPAWLGIELLGPRILSVFDGSPARAGGLHAFDEVLAIDGYRANTDADIRKRLQGRRPGMEVKLTVFRGDKLETAAVRLGKSPPQRFVVSVVPEPSEEAKLRFSAWLDKPLPKPGLLGQKTLIRWL